MSKHPKGRVGLARIVHATGYSMAGLASAYRFESAFRQECWAAAALIPSALFLGRTLWERLALIGVVLFVMIVELLNSGIEATVDRVSLERHELSKRAKDQASAAVFLAVAFACATWIGVIADRYFQ